jgi:ABC-type transport system involved in cytochrome bd biosynthesis fused ATPase/permease subunit
MILGDIGSGKSSLLMAILNELLSATSSRINICGSIAYSPQKPWIMSETLKKNITFSGEFDQKKFEKVIYYASLEADLKMLPKGVETDIGEKGINISGGQKARVSLARSLYSDRDILLLDDILSAVDVHVGEFIVKETVREYLKGKTVIMPTHAIKFAPFADEIIVMKKGRIVRKGGYQDICNTPEF